VQQRAGSLGAAARETRAAEGAPAMRARSYELADDAYSAQGY
jgi:hypothetical protein